MSAPPRTEGWRETAGPAVLLVLVSLASQFLFRGLVADDSTLAWEWADNFLGRSPLDPDHVTEDFPPLFPIVIYLSFLAFGHDLVALHLPSFLAALCNPVLFYLLARDVLGSRRWGLVAGFLFLAWPTAIFFFNQAVAEPITLAIALASLLAYERGRLGAYLVLAPLSMFSAYDAVLLHGAIALESFLRWRGSRFHARLSQAVLGAAAVAAVGVVLDLLVLEAGLLPYFRIQANVTSALREHGFSFLAVKARLIAWYYFGVLLLPVVAFGAAIEIRRRRVVWATASLAGYLLYETMIRHLYSPTLIVTLRHLSLVVPSAALLACSALQRAAGAWPSRGATVRRLLVAYASLTVLAVAAVQARYAYYLTAVQIATTPAEIARLETRLPVYVHASARWPSEASIDRPFDALAPDASWQERVLDCRRVVEEAFPAGPAYGSLDVITIRGEVDLAEVWVEGGPSRLPRTPIPLEDFRPLYASTRFDPLDPSARALRSPDGFLGGVAYPIDGSFIEGGRVDRVGFVLRGSGPFSISVGARLAGGAPVFFAFHPPLPEIVREPGRVELECIRTMNDQIQREVLGFFRPEGLWMMGPLLGYEHLYHQVGREVEERPAGVLRRTIVGDADTSRPYLGPTAGGEVEILYAADYERAIAHLSVAAFFAHLVPGDRAAIEIQRADGSWHEIGRSQGTLQRRHWGAELEDPLAGSRSLRLRVTLVAADWLPESLRRRIPMGVRDLSIGVQLAPPGR